MVSPPCQRLCRDGGCWVTVGCDADEYVMQQGRVVDIFHCRRSVFKLQVQIKLETTGTISLLNNIKVLTNIYVSVETLLLLFIKYLLIL